MSTTPPPPSPPSAEATTTQTPQPAPDLQRVSHRPRAPPLAIAPPDPRWPARYERLRRRIAAALGPRALSVAHVGSTSVPGMPAKPILDVDVVVADPTDEGSYVSALVGEGWETTGTGRGRAAGDGGAAAAASAGLQFLFREPGWYEHRFFVCDPGSDGEGEDGDEDGDGDGDHEGGPPPAPRCWAHVHVFGPGCPELVRHQVFREWLLEHPEDRETYARAKREASEASREAGESMTEYNQRKEPVVLEILDRALRARGLLGLG